VQQQLVSFAAGERPLPGRIAHQQIRNPLRIEIAGPRAGDHVRLEVSTGTRRDQLADFVAVQRPVFAARPDQDLTIGQGMDARAAGHPDRDGWTIRRRQ
jgi:hypothetical protein